MAQTRKNYQLYLVPPAQAPANLHSPIPANCPTRAVILALDETAEGYQAFFVNKNRWLSRNGRLHSVKLGKQAALASLAHGLIKEGAHENLLKAALARAGLTYYPTPPLNKKRLQAVAAHLDWRGKLVLARNNGFLYSLFKADLRVEHAKLLVAEALNGQTEKVLKELKADPSLLFEKGGKQKVVVKRGSLQIEGSLFQALLGAKDFAFLDKLKPLLAKDPQRLLAQLLEQYPEQRSFFKDGKIKEEKKLPLSLDFSKLMKALDEEKFQQSCLCFSQAEVPDEKAAMEMALPLQARAAFIRCKDFLIYLNQDTREYHKRTLPEPENPGFDWVLKPKPMAEAKPLEAEQLAWIRDNLGFRHEGLSAQTAETFQALTKQVQRPLLVKQGEHFNASNLIFAFDLYIARIKNAWLSEDKKCSFFFRRLLGLLEKDLPANYAQTLCGGYKKIAGVKDLVRSLALHNGEDEQGYFFDPGLGSSFAIICLATHASRVGVGCLQFEAENTRQVLKTLVSSKDQDLNEFMIWVKALLSQLQQKPQQSQTQQKR